MESNLEKVIPIGCVGKLEKETVLLSSIDNKIEYLNPNIKFPFKLSEGERTDLGVFLSPTIKEEEKTYKAEVQPYHGRAALLGRAIIEDNEGRCYRDISAQGVGHVFKKVIFSFSGTPGILNYEGAVADKDVSEEMLKLRLRTSRTLAIIRLKEIFDKEGHKISIEEAKKNGIIEKADDPVIEIRLLGINARIQDLTRDPRLDYSKEKGRCNSLVEDARMMVAQELGKKEIFSLTDYVYWFAQNLGKQIAIMHRNGWTHNCLTEQNITLDGRIVDMGTAEQYSKQKPEMKNLIEKIQYSQDLERGARSLRKFWVEMYRYVAFDQGVAYNQDADGMEMGLLIEKFKKSYFENLRLPEENRLKVEEGLKKSVERGWVD